MRAGLLNFLFKKCCFLANDEVLFYTGEGGKVSIYEQNGTILIYREEVRVTAYAMACLYYSTILVE